MAEFKRKALVFSSGKQVKLFGSSIAIGRTLEIGEGYAPNILSAAPAGIANPHGLTAEEVMELADYAMQLWMELKNNVRRHGLDAGRVFEAER